MIFKIIYHLIESFSHLIFISMPMLIVHLIGSHKHMYAHTKEGIIGAILYTFSKALRWNRKFFFPSREDVHPEKCDKYLGVLLLKILTFIVV